MTAKEFIRSFKNLIQSNERITLDSPLNHIKGFDSLAKLLMMAWLNDEFKIKISAQELTAMKTVNDILKLINHAS